VFRKGFHSFSGKRVLLLQGPVGPFFRRLETDLLDVGASVIKINFNGGDWFFSHKSKALNFRDSLSAWPEYFRQVIDHYHIDIVLLFGDCRVYHQLAHQIAMEQGIDIGVFEEGYIRPHYVTLEMYGVNGNSTLSKDPVFYLGHSLLEKEPTPVKNPFWPMGWCATFYYMFSFFLSPLFLHYQHHRPLHIFEGLYWFRSVWRKWRYKSKEKGLESFLAQANQSNFYLVPLQTHNDAQIVEHSDFHSVDEFIEVVLSSFAMHAPKSRLLVFKHHPLDRGYRDYTSLIAVLCRKYHIDIQKVLYIHDQHLPTLLDAACGVVVVNSTVGLSALYHHAPVKVMGESIYDIRGLTYQGDLDSFWCDADSFELNRDLYAKYKDFLVASTQLNGSFYRALKSPYSHAGLIWPS
jgi:capsular polysaccharide export protein